MCKDISEIIPLTDYPVHHAGRSKVIHPQLQRQIYAQTAVRYVRFLRTVQIAYLDLPLVAEKALSGRWVPNVPTHPAHIVVSTLNKSNNQWEKVVDLELPPNPKCAGEGLSQNMPIEEMEAHFLQALMEQAPHRIEFRGFETDCLRIECDREHPVWPNHGEINGGPFNVPFGILHPLSAVGKDLGVVEVPFYRRKLVRSDFTPAAPEGMVLDTRNPLEVIFHGEQLAVGFSLVRPMLTRFDWDHFGDRQLIGNRLLFRSGQNGPTYITSGGDFVPQNMTGTVEVTGNKVRYIGIDTGAGITVNAIFTVTSDALTVELEQEAEADHPVIEGEVWRLLWNMRAGLTSVAALPLEREGRNGFVQLPALIVSDNGSSLVVKLLEGNGYFHTESYRQQEMRSTGFIIGRLDTPNTPQVIPKGRQRAVFEMSPCALLPVPAEKEATLSDGLKRCWTAGFSAFRPEFGGFSNNAISTNCHVNQHTAFDFAAFTERPCVGPDPLELVKFSVGRALLDAGGYGYHRNLYLDTDPILLSGAGRIIQFSNDRVWLNHVAPGIRDAAQRILANFDVNEGMIVCHSLSGNSGDFRWSSNCMDVIGFGHIDAYVNAWSFRGLKNATALCARLGYEELAVRCAEVAETLKTNYARQLVNPETGWVSGWRSSDTQLHDYGFLWINGVACAFGVMDKAKIRQALVNLESKRAEVFPESGYHGLPLNLVPIAPNDHMLPKFGYKTKPTYENYTDGALSPLAATYYLRALSLNGLAEGASALADNLERGFADGIFHGPYGTGKEFMTWTGADSGYEGTFGPNSGPLYAIAVERGIITPPDPEWWLTDEDDKNIQTRTPNNAMDSVKK